MRAFIAGKRLFFVATAPSGPGGHVNVMFWAFEGPPNVVRLHGRCRARLDMERKGELGRIAYRQQKNSVSLDGLPAFDFDPPVQSRPHQCGGG